MGLEAALAIAAIGVMSLYAGWVARQELGARFGVRAPLYAALGAGAMYALSVIGAVAGEAGALACVFVLLAAIGEIDARRQIIPDLLSGPLFVLALIATRTGSLADAAMGAALLGGLLLAVRMFFTRFRGEEALGLGDVKLAAALGALLGLSVALWALIGAAIATMLYMIFRGERRAPFGVGLSAAALFALMLSFPTGSGV